MVHQTLKQNYTFKQTVMIFILVSLFALRIHFYTQKPPFSTNTNVSLDDMKPEILVYYQTSRNTRTRLKEVLQLWSLFPTYRPYFSFIETVCEEPPKSQPEYMQMYLPPGCGCCRDCAVCRFHYSILDFVQNPNNTQYKWMFIADDDTLIRGDSLYHYTKEMESFLDPTVNPVFKGHANREMRNILYVHGGAGFLMSRAMCEFMTQTGEDLFKYVNWSRYRQPDTTMALIVRKMYAEREWDEWGFVGDIDKNAWKKAVPPPCLDNITYPFNRILSIHSRGINKNIHQSFVNTIGAPDDYQFYRIPNQQVTRVCIDVRSETIPLRDRTPVKTFADFPVPLYPPEELFDEDTINWTSYLPDWYNNDGFDHSPQPGRSSKFL